MTQAIGWLIALLIAICIGSPFCAWWKLRQLRSSLQQLSIHPKDGMPPVRFFGSYRKSLSWATKHQEELPGHLASPIKQALLFDKLAFIAFGVLIAIAAISMVLKR